MLLDIKYGLMAYTAVIILINNTN